MPYVPERGDIIYIDFSPQAGREQANRRPALVLSPSTYNSRVGLLVAVPITSNAKGYPFEVALPPTLETHGVALSDHVKSLDWRVRNAQFTETVPDTVVDEVTARIAALLRLS